MAPIPSVRLEVKYCLDLVPFTAFMARQSPIMTVYLYAAYVCALNTRYIAELTFRELGEWSVGKFKLGFDSVLTCSQRVADHFKSLGTVSAIFEIWSTLTFFSH